MAFCKYKMMLALTTFRVPVEIHLLCVNILKYSVPVWQSHATCVNMSSEQFACIEVQAVFCYFDGGDGGGVVMMAVFVVGVVVYCLFHSLRYT